MTTTGTIHAICTRFALLLLGLFATVYSTVASAEAVLPRFLPELTAGELLPRADAFGPIRPDVPVVPILKKGETVGWAFVTSDFVGTTGYSGKPIHVVVAVSNDAVVTGIQLVKHSEPIVLIGIPESKIKRLIENYIGLDLKNEAVAGGSGHDLDIISGATVTIMVIDDSVVRSGLKVARELGLGGLAPKVAREGPKRSVDTSIDTISSWSTLAGDGSIRSLNLDVGQINRAFKATGDRRTEKRREKGEADDLFIEMDTALVSVPSIGRSLLGEAEYANLQNWLKPGEHAILVTGRGRYSFKGSGYVRGGIFDRIQLIQGDASVRFRDRGHRRIGELAPEDTPSFTELDLFRIPADGGFDPTEPWRLQLLVHRAVGAVEKSFITFDLGYRLPDRFVAIENPPVATTVSAKVDDSAEAAAKTALWQRIWRDRTFEISVVAAMLLILSGAFFFQLYVTRSEKFLFWFRISFLTVTLVFIGWYANAQLSVVNLLALASSMQSGFSWDAFLLDPVVFILWFSVAAALLFWGRGAYCGWLCPFGALQELTNRLAKLARIPQWELRWGLHERLWPFKYIIFLGLFGLSLVSLPMAEGYAEVEPFKTAIILKFQRSWPFLLYVFAILAAGLFVERFYCRYLCPLGAALAIPARLRMFDWLKRYKECGSPCQRCAQECMVQAIHPTGEINPNECLNCLNCQVLYQHKGKCPVVMKKIKKRADFERRNKPIINLPTASVPDRSVG